MARPVEKMPAEEPWIPDSAVSQEAEEESTLLRWVERPDGELEQVELTLTPELFLNPQLEDKWLQGQAHDETARELTDLLVRHFRPQPDVLVTHEMKHLFGRGLPAPAPDVSVIRGIRKRDADRRSFSARKEGVVPCLVIEVVSPYSARIRRTDLERKVEAYERVGIYEYLIVDSPREAPSRWYSLLGYRLDAQGRYQPIKPDAEGRILSETTDLWFQVSPDRSRILLFEHPSGRPLLTSTELEETVAREAEARKIAEAELVRLQEEIERLRGPV
ncbi:MAG TPA: Uma2 family endonuclease [Thermoanaerobaculia bacterium]|nr:Uma2 family endonuclease [Thermoanaerobaculia bacterium]